MTTHVYTGDKTVQCGRKVDVLKLWLMWKAEGDEGMEQAVDKAFDNARYKIITFRHIKALYMDQYTRMWYLSW